MNSNVKIKWKVKVKKKMFKLYLGFMSGKKKILNSARYKNQAKCKFRKMKLLYIIKNHREGHS